MRGELTVLRPIENVGRIFDIIHSDEHHGYPIVDDYQPPIPDLEDSTRSNGGDKEFGRLQGLILRSQIITLLQNRVGSVRRWCWTAGEDGRLVYPFFKSPFPVV